MPTLLVPTLLLVVIHNQSSLGMKPHTMLPSPIQVIPQTLKSLAVFASITSDAEIMAIKFFLNILQMPSKSLFVGTRHLRWNVTAPNTGSSGLGMLTVLYKPFNLWWMVLTLGWLARLFPSWLPYVVLHSMGCMAYVKVVCGWQTPWVARLALNHRSPVQRITTSPNGDALIL